MSNHRQEETNIENIDWNQFSLEQLKLVQSKISKAIDLNRRDLRLTQSTANSTQVYRYKASLAKVFPLHPCNSVSQYQTCVFAISLGSKNFVYRDRLAASIQWISEQFKTCLVLVGDSVYRLTLQIRNGLKDNQTRLEALHTGQEFVAQNVSLFEQYSQRCRFQFKLASDIEKQSDFGVYYQEFQSLYQNSESYQRMANSFAQAYLNRGKQAEAEQVQEFPQRQKHLAITYLLEESALFTCIAQAGWNVFVYPGSIKTFEEIAEGLHPEVPLPLQHIIWLSLRLKNS